MINYGVRYFCLDLLSWILMGFQALKNAWDFKASPADLYFYDFLLCREVIGDVLLVVSGARFYTNSK